MLSLKERRKIFFLVWGRGGRFFLVLINFILKRKNGRFFFEAQKENLKNRKADTLEEILKSWKCFIIMRMKLRQQIRV